MTSWGELTGEQRSLVSVVQHWIDAFGSQPFSVRSEVPGFLPSPRNPVYSNLVLLDDAQEELLRFLLLYWRELYLKGFDGVRERSSLAPSASSGLGVVESWGHLIRPKVSIVPFEPISINPSPDATSLVLMLASRLYEVFGSTQSFPPFSSPVEQPPESAWREFQWAASRWDGNLMERKGYLDPESYAVELEDTERAHLGLASSWRRLVDTLVSYVEERLCQPNPVLIVSITGSDFNPGHRSELLKLAGTLRHERVALILAGDSSLYPSGLQVLSSSCS
jgi:hypothetical protein